MLTIIALIIIGLFALSAFWSGSETALTSLSKPRIKKIIALKKNLADPLRQWLRAPAYLLTTILIGNTVTNVLLSSLATLFMVQLFSPLGTRHTELGRGMLEFVTWLSLTFLLLVFSEIAPKIFCRAHP